MICEFLGVISSASERTSFWCSFHPSNVVAFVTRAVGFGDPNHMLLCRSVSAKQIDAPTIFCYRPAFPIVLFCFLVS